MERYQVFLHLELLEAIPKRQNHRQQILKFIHSLQDYPFIAGDFTDKNASLQIRQIKIVGDFAVTYWVDHPVKTVMIVDISRADH